MLDKETAPNGWQANLGAHIELPHLPTPPKRGQLRKYQEIALTAALAGFREFDRQLLVAPTGSGKTVMFAHLADRFLPARTLVLVHREELLAQAANKIESHTGIRPELEMAEHHATHAAQIVVASVQSMIRRLKKWPQDHFGLVVADEAHHALADSWQAVLGHFTGAKILGVTATPDRGDKKQLGGFFENVAAEISLVDLIREQYLSRISVKALPLEIDLTGVRQIAGDFSDSDLGDALVPYLHSIAKSIYAEAADRRTLAFLPLIKTSRAFVDCCRDVGISAEHVDGNSPDRKEILARFAAGEFRLLSNAALLTEGFDDPGIDCVAILRPTRSRPLYSQMVGRGTRVAPGKRDLLLLDFLWLHERHNLIRPAHLIASTDEQARAMTELAQGGETQDLLDLASEAEAEREQHLREQLKANVGRKAKTIDAMEFCLSLHAVDVADWEDVSPWHSMPATAAQITTLERSGIDLASIKSRGHASALIDLIVQRGRMNLATPKQLRWLKQFGHPSPNTATFDDASAFLDRHFNKLRRAA